MLFLETQMSKILINTSNLDDIFNMSADKIRIIHIINNDNRKILHQYMENSHSKFYKTSLKCKHFTNERLHTYIRCYECDFSRVNIDEYHNGYMDSNIDEWRLGKCHRCGTHINFEPNYDDWDDIHIQYKNNIVAF